MIPATTTPLPCTTAPGLFFAPDHERGPDRNTRVYLARQLCNTCPIIDACRTEPRTGEQGVWGGLDEHDRAKATGTRVRHDRPIRARVPAKCGTTAGAAKHRRLKQRVCEYCLAAEREAGAAARARRAARAPEHGTRGGYQRHRKLGETACDPCRQANADADRRLRTTGTTRAAA